MRKSFIKSARSLWRSFPIILGTILLVSFITAVVPKSFYVSLFGRSGFFNVFLADVVGSISAGNPITSYIFGGEMLKQGISLTVVSVFLVAWVTVGIVQLPAEATLLGKRFAIVRNLVSFILAVVVGVLTVLLLGVIS